MAERNIFAELVVKAKDGDQEAFRLIYDSLHGRVFAYARSHTSSKEEAIDLVQETMIMLWEALPTFEYRSDDTFLAFVFMILKRRMIKLYTAHSRKTFSLERMLEEAGEGIMPKETPEYEDYRVLARAIESISPGARDVLSLRYWSGYSFREIAVALGIKESAAKVRHHRAINELRKQLGSYGYAQY